MLYLNLLLLNRLYTYWRSICLTIMFSSLTGSLLAATVAEEQTATELSRSIEQQQRERAQQQELDELTADSMKPIQLPEVEELPEFTEEAVCFDINEIKVEGLLSDWIKETGSIYLGQCIGQQAIAAFIRQINQQLLHDGFVTSRAVLPEQDLSQGALTISVLEGRVEDIVFPEDYGFYWQNAVPLKIGEILNMRDMEQGIDQLNRLGSQDIELKIEPGEEHGSSKIVAYVTPSKRWQYNLSIDNSGSESTGEYPLSSTIYFDNSFGIQDVLTYSNSRDSDTDETKGSVSDTLSLSVPLGYWLLELSATDFNYYQTVEGEVTTYISSGTGHDEEISLDQTIFRDNKIKLSWSVGLKKRTRRTYVADTEVEIQSRNLTHVELGLNHRHYLSNSVLNVSLTAKQGVDLLNAEAEDPDATEDTAQPDFRLFSLSVAYNRPLEIWGKRTNLSSQLTAQYNDTALYSLDWFSNGGRYTVRGFNSDESVSSERGWRVKNDLTIPVTIMEYPISSYIGWDFGNISGDGADDYDETDLMGITLGAKGKLYDANYEVFFSRPFLIYGPEATNSCCEFGAKLSYNF